jgi:hypothetical protein
MELIDRFFVIVHDFFALPQDWYLWSVPVFFAYSVVKALFTVALIACILVPAWYYPEIATWLYLHRKKMVAWVVRKVSKGRSRIN